MNPFRTRLALLTRTTQRRYVTVLDPQNTGCSPMKPTTSVGPIETAIRTRVSEAFSRRDRKGRDKRYIQLCDDGNAGGGIKKLDVLVSSG